MMERRIYHVVRGSDDLWQVVREGFHRPHMVSPTKERAVVMAKRLAKTGSPGQVVIHNRNDAVESRLTFYFSSEPEDRG